MRVNSIEFDYSTLIPRYLTDDRNGAAMAAAIGAGMQALIGSLDTVETLLCDVDTMPEWALDEAAWASAMPWYDFSADLETKRGWVKNADEIRAMIGTKGAIRRLLLGIYESCNVEEYWEYGGDAHHFRVAVKGTYSEQKSEWARKAIEAVRPLRSVLDGISIGSTDAIAMLEEAMFGVCNYPVCGVAICGAVGSL